MRGLSEEEARQLWECRPSMHEGPQIQDGEEAILNGLVKRGCMRYWIDANETEWWETSPLGMLAISCHIAMRWLT
jgi:hypothetical protein